jgi:hypothetical protein
MCAAVTKSCSHQFRGFGKDLTDFLIEAAESILCFGSGINILDPETYPRSSISNSDPGSGAFLTPGSGIGDEKNLDVGWKKFISRIWNPE